MRSPPKGNVFPTVVMDGDCTGQQIAQLRRQRCPVFL